MKYKSIVIVFMFVIISPLTASAKLSGSVMLDPVNPTPHGKVTLTLVSYSFNVNQSDIVWSSRGKELLHGVGEKRLVVETGAVGESAPIHVSATLITGESIGIDVTITPESVDIVYETDESYTPLFYEGHSLPGEGATIKFVAMPNISEGSGIIPAKSLSYLWYIDGSFVDSASGIGRQVANLSLSILKNKSDIKVVARSPRGVSAEKTITVYPHAVMPLLYTYDEVLGVKLNSPILRRYEATRDFTVSLQPFFLSSKKELDDTAIYTWLLDGLPITPLGGMLLTLHPKEDSYGSKKLSVSIENKQRRRQKATVDADIIFDTRK